MLLAGEVREIKCGPVSSALETEQGARVGVPGGEKAVPWTVGMTWASPVTEGRGMKG